MSPADRDPARVDPRTLLAAIVDSSDDAIFSKDLQGTILSWNPGAERLYGYAADEIVGQSVFVLVPEGRADEVREILDALRAGRTVDHFETIRRGKDGTPVPVSLTISPILDHDGRVVAASTIARDITERRRIAEHAERVEGILAAAHDAFVGMDAAGAITHWNAAAERLFGWPADEAIGRRLSETIIPDRYRQRHEAGLRRYLEVGDGPVLGQRVELDALHRDGHEIPIGLSVFVTGTAEVPSFNAFVHDLSEHKRLLAELEAARDDALEASRLKSDFLATMSHEIRTPMNGVMGMAGLLLDTELDPEQREYAEIVHASADALLGIINDILDFSKIEAGQLDLEVVDVDLQALVEQVVDLLAPHAHAKGLELAVLVRPDVPPVVRGDPGRLRQILLNLLSNAVKFTESGEVVVRATASDPSDGHVTLHFQVADTGIGIHPDNRERLFEPFSQADSSTTRTFGGTGLGLAICRRLVELLGGDLTVDSELGRGSTFEFTIRLEIGDAISARPPRTDLTGLRVLVVDDNDTNRRILEQQVRAWGMTSAVADGAPAAIDLLRRAHEENQPFDVAILDKGMPGTDGIELTRMIRHDDSVPIAPVVLLTSAGVRGAIDEARRAGVSAYLTKPVHQSQLFDALMTVLGPADEPSAPVTQSSIARGRAAARPVVLVAEDNPANQKVAAAMLAKIGYRADVVGNGAEAVEAVQRIKYGAVLMDCQMPEMDGYAATAEIRRNERDHDRLPIIAMTAAAMDGEEERCLLAGMDDYVTKPVSIDRLAAALKRWVATPADEGPEAAMSQASTDGGPFEETTLASLTELMADEPGGFVGLVERFVESVAESLAAGRRQLATGDTETLARELHSIIGGAAAVGANRLASACRHVERQLTRQPPHVDADAVAAIDSELHHVEAWLRSREANRAHQDRP